MSNSDWETVRDRSNSALALDPGNADAQAFLAAAGRSLRAPPAPAASEPAAPAVPEPQPLLAEAPADPRRRRFQVGRSHAVDKWSISHPVDWAIDESTPDEKIHRVKFTRDPGGVIAFGIGLGSTN